MITSIPCVKCYMRETYAYDMDPSKTGYIPGYLIAVTAIKGKALLFTFLGRNGAMFARMPISAFCWKDAAPQELGILELWDAISYDIHVESIEFLKHFPVRALLRDGKVYNGTYLFTVDFYGVDSLAETPDEHKHSHVIKLNNGNFAIQPGNRLQWIDASICDELFTERPDYKVNTHEFFAEDGAKWVASEEMFYDTKLRD